MYWVIRLAGHGMKNRVEIMKRKYFGTDGIRGTANRFPMTADIAMRVGMAAGIAFRRGDHRHVW